MSEPEHAAGVELVIRAGIPVYMVRCLRCGLIGQPSRDETTAQGNAARHHRFGDLDNPTAQEDTP